MRTLTTPALRPTLRSRRVAKLLVTVAVAASVALVGACDNKDTASAKSSASPTASASASASASPSASPTPTIKPSTNLDGITVKGAYGKKPTITFKHPFAIDKTQSKVLHSGNGGVVADTSQVTVDYAGVDGRTGKTFDSSFAKGQPASFPMNGVIAGFKKGLVDKHVGDRVLVAMTGPDGYDSSGGNAQAGINVGDTLVFVIDIHAVSLTKAEGKTDPPKAGLPTVTMTGDKPTVTIPSTNPPTAITVEPLITGTGPKVKAGDNVTTRSITVLWKGDKVVDNSWATPWTPQLNPTTNTYEPARNAAMQQAMVGQTVGSRLVMVFPPGTAYKDPDRSQGITAQDTVVMVVDILFTQPGQ